MGDQFRAIGDFNVTPKRVSPYTNSYTSVYVEVLEAKLISSKNSMDKHFNILANILEAEDKAKFLHQAFCNKTKEEYKIYNTILHTDAAEVTEFSFNDSKYEEFYLYGEIESMGFCSCLICQNFFKEKQNRVLNQSFTSSVPWVLDEEDLIWLGKEKVARVLSSLRMHNYAGTQNVHAMQDFLKDDAPIQIIYPNPYERSSAFFMNVCWPRALYVDNLWVKLHIENPIAASNEDLQEVIPSEIIIHAEDLGKQTEKVLGLEVDSEEELLGEGGQTEEITAGTAVQGNSMSPQKRARSPETLSTQVTPEKPPTQPRRAKGKGLGKRL
jgi:hypothetical protein